VLMDALASTGALTNASAAVQTSYTCEPFGQATVTGAWTTNPIGFTGREGDGTGLGFLASQILQPDLRQPKLSSLNVQPSLAPSAAPWVDAALPGAH
jgi:hypothetical protein